MSPHDLPPNLTATLVATDAVRVMIRGGDDALTIAQATVIDTPEMATIANEQLRDVKVRLKRAQEIREEFLAPLRQLVDTTNKYLNPAIDSYKNAEKLLKDGLADWQRKEDERIATERRAAEEAQRKARQEAEAKAAAERARAEEQARQQQEKARQESEARARAEEQARIAAEAKRKAQEDGDKEAARAAAEQERKAREEAQARAAAEAKAIEQAASTLENGNAKAAQMTLAAETTTSVPVVERAVLKGFNTRKNYVAELKPGTTEEQALEQIVAAAEQRPDLLAYLTLDMKALNKSAKALEERFNVPGFVAKNKPVASSRAA